MSKPHLIVYVPGWKLSPYHAQSREALIIEAMRSGKFDITIVPDQTSGIDRSRNICTANFLQSDGTHMMFIDSDVSFDPKDVVIMLESGLPIVGAAHPGKDIDWGRVENNVKNGETAKGRLKEMVSRSIVNVEDPNKLRVLIDSSGNRFLDVKTLPTSFLMMRREAIVKFIEAYKHEIAYRTDYEPLGATHYAIWRQGMSQDVGREAAARALVVAARNGKSAERLFELAMYYRDACGDPSALPIFETEDWKMSTMWRMLGERLYCLLDCKLHHTGNYVFEGCLGHEVQLELK